MVWIVVADGGRVVPVHRCPPLRVDQHQVRRFTRAQGAALPRCLPDPGRGVAHSIGHLLPGQAARGDHGFHHHRQGLFQPQHPRSGVDKGMVLVLRGVGCVVCGDRIDGAVGQSGSHCLDVFVGAQRGIDLEGGVVSHDLRGGQVQVMGSCFGGHPDAPFLRPAQHVHALRS